MAVHERIAQRLGALIVERPLRVVLAFLLVTALLGVGLGGISTEAGTDQFTQNSDASEALDAVDREFGATFTPGGGSTQLIQRGSNVLGKPALLRMLRTQERLEDRDGLRVTDTSSAATVVAQTLDPSASTTEAQIRTVERATPGEIDRAVRQAEGSLAGLLSEDFNAESASASATIGSVSHSVPGTGSGPSAGTSGSSPLQSIQQETVHVVKSGPDGGAGITVFGTGILSAEFSNVIFDSLVIVVPAAAALILVFLVFSYRDPLDLVLGVVSLVMAVVWTFGFMGIAGIPFTQMLVAVPPLLLAVGIDFGIHTINRYREERAKGSDTVPAMEVSVEQLLVAFFIVTGTTVLGFLANVTSDLGPIRDFGIVAAIGIVFTFLIFGLFLPAAKVLTDRFRERVGLPRFGGTPLGEEGSLLGTVLPAGLVAARRAPYVFLLLVLVVTAGVGFYGTGVDTSFSQDDFLPPEEVPDYLESLPEPLAPGEYSSTEQLNFLEDRFATAQTSSVTMYVEGRMRQDFALESIQRAGRDPPNAFAATDRQADAESILGVIDTYAAADPEFAALVDRNDVDDDGVPDDNLEEIYDELFASPYADQARQYLSEDYRSAKVVYTAESSASQIEVSADARALADDYRLDATPTGQTIVFQAVSDIIFASALTSLVVALAATALFLVFIYWLFEGFASLGLVNLAPIVVTLALLAGTMRLFAVPFNALTATVLAIAIGLGIDYSAHVVHRFADEYDGTNTDEALERTVRGTGGALAGSMLTTTTGIGVLVLAITPILGQFGLVTALAVFYSFLASLLVTPAAVVVWDDLRGGNEDSAETPGAGTDTDADANGA